MRQQDRQLRHHAMAWTWVFWFVFPDGRCGGQFADRHLVRLDEQYIHQVAFDGNRPVFFGGSRDFDFIFSQYAAAGYFSAASCRRDLKRLIRLLPLGSVRFLSLRCQILMPKSVWSGNISRTLIMLFFFFQPKAGIAGTDFAVDGGGFDVFGF